MGEIFGFLAKECGWDFKFISKNLTLSQIKRYYDTIFEAKKYDFLMFASSVFYASATAQGTMKPERFQDFLNMFEPYKRINVKKSIELMKKDGLPIEEN